MNTSITKLIAVLATVAGLLTTSAALAKGPGKSGGKSGNSSSRSMSGSPKTSSNFNAFKLNGSSKLSSNHSNSSSNFLSTKNTGLSQVFKKQDLNKDFNKDFSKKSIGGLGITFGGNSKGDKKFDKYSKDFFFKNNNKWWFNSCYPKNYCYPYYFGGCFPTYSCYYPIYSCYDYCTPAYYSSSNYGNYNSNITVLQNTGPTRTRVAVGSVLMVNGQAFGDKAGGARLRISGMAMPIEVLEWTPGGVKVRLPQVEITGSTPADIEVVRGDGSLASKTAVELTASPEQLALGR